MGRANNVNKDMPQQHKLWREDWIGEVKAERVRNRQRLLAIKVVKQRDAYAYF